MLILKDIAINVSVKDYNQGFGMDSYILRKIRKEWRAS